MPPPTCNYLTSVNGPTALMHLIGNASYVNCGPMSEFLQSLVQREGRTDLAVDFRHCTGLDSTVLGLLAKVAMDLAAKAPVGRVVLANLDGRNLELVKNLGLHHVCQLAETPVPTHMEGASALQPGATGSMCADSCLLEAHEALVKAHRENESKFRDVIEALMHR